MESQDNENTGNTASGFQVALIMLGIAVTPALLASAGLGSTMPSLDVFKVVVLGGAIVTVLGIVNLTIGAVARKTTYEIVRYPFGKTGANAINVLLAISLFGWITVTANTFGHSLHELLLRVGVDVPVPALVAIGSVIFVASTAFGIEVLGKVAQWAVPIIALALGYICYTVVSADFTSTVTESSISFGAAVSSVVGTVIVLVTLSPDFGSFVHNKAHAKIAAVVAFAVAYPVLFWVGAFPSSLTGEGSLLGAMAVIGPTLAASLLLLGATITGNGGNMFQGTLVVSSLLPDLPRWQITVALGVLSTIVASFDIIGLIIPFLIFLGIVTPPIAGIYIADFLANRRNGYEDSVLDLEAGVKPLTFVAWLVASAVGFATVNDYFTLTSIPSLDSILIAAVLYFIFCKIKK